MSPGRMIPVDEASDILTPTSDDQIARLGEIAALRAITGQLDRMGLAMQNMISGVNEVKTDVALLKQSDEKIGEVSKVATRALDLALSLQLEMARNDGRSKGVISVRDWLLAIPGIGSIGLMLYAFARLGVLPH